jgi:sensor histidine kinase YesM
MNWYNLVFSNQKSYRFRRHLFFWIAWCIYFLLAFLIPVYWVPGWNLKGPMPQIEKYGVVVSILRLLMNTTLMAVVHMGLVYGILYFFLPRYLSKNKNWIVTTGMLLVFLVVIACINYLNFLITFAISTQLGYFKKMPDMEYVVPVWGRQILLNYPSIVGFALAVKLLKNWYLKQRETEQLTHEKIQSELQLLKAQVHPHFLFNTLNNIYSFILNGSPDAPHMIKKLSSLLRYIIYECNQPMVNLGKELNMIRDYLDLEKIRYGDNFNMSLQVQGSATDKMIYPLLLIPFIENSFKHGTSQMLTHPWVNVDIAIEEQTLHFKLSNSKPDWPQEFSTAGGIGLSNVKKRLALLYPGTHSLNITEDKMSFEVSLKIEVFKPEINKQQEIRLTQKAVHEVV